MTEFDFYLFMEKNKPKGELLWFALKSKDFEILEELIDDGYIPAMLEKFKMALDEGCFEQAQQLKEMLLVSLKPDENPDLESQARFYMDNAIEAATQHHAIIE